MSKNTVSLHRVLKASPEKVYRAFTDANALASWIPSYGFLCTVHELKYMTYIFNLKKHFVLALWLERNNYNL